MKGEFAEEDMYDNFGLYTLYYYHTYGYEPHWAISMNWRMFRAVFEGDDDEFARLQNSFQYSLARYKLGGWN